ncbi:MAG: hypothetical protein N2053_04175, partial [Chitinispirillaceae bacterium]|nr:hypothetical protein [Chitinispirillaceae bacterium]
MKKRSSLLSILLFSISLVYSDVIVVCKPEMDSTVVGSETNVIGKLLVAAIQSKYSGNVIYSDSICTNKECGVKIAKENNSNEVVFSTILKLGNKFIYTASIVKSDGSNLFSQKLTTDNIEKFEELCDMMAYALLNRKNSELGDSVKKITKENQPMRGRTSYYSWGLSAGVAYGAIGKKSFKYNNNERRAMLFKLGWTNLWEFENNLGLDIELLCFLPTSFGGDASLIYFFDKSDFSPFAGGGFGIHFLPNKNENRLNTLETDEKRFWGPSLNIQGGLMMFRTYNIHLIPRAQYHVVFTDDIDNCISGDITFLIENRKKDKDKKTNFWDVMRDYLLYTTIATVA